MTDLELLSNRVLEMERRQRQLRRAAFTLCMVVAAGSIMAQTRPSAIRPPVGERLPLLQEKLPPVSRVVEAQVRAKQFILVDDDGKERASLVTDGAGSVFLVLFDKNEKSRANLSVSNDGPSLVFYDPSGQARTVLGSTTMVASHLNEKGVVERAPASSIVLFDRSGKLLFRQP